MAHPALEVTEKLKGGEEWRSSQLRLPCYLHVAPSSLCDGVTVVSPALTPHRSARGLVPCQRTEWELVTTFQTVELGSRRDAELPVARCQPFNESIGVGLCPHSVGGVKSMELKIYCCKSLRV